MRVLVVDEVHRAAGHLHPGAQHRLVDVVAEEALAPERRQQRGVDVEDAPAPRRGDRQADEVAAEQREVDSVRLEVGEDRGAEAPLVREIAGAQHRRGDAEARGALQGGALGGAGDAAHDVGP
jgi:hypothetical protein